MANNRMAIKCLECGRECIIARYDPTPPFDWTLYAGVEARLQRFLTAHMHDFDYMDGATHFSIDYESGVAHSTVEIDEHNKKAGYEDISIFEKGITNG